MRIGYLRNFKQPQQLAGLIASVAQTKRVDILYFTPKDVDVRRSRIRGLLYKDGEWKLVKAKIPKIIDVNSNCLKHREVIRHLRKRAHLTENGKNRLSKLSLQEQLKADSNYQKFTIPTKNCSSFSEIEEFLNEYDDIVLRPIHSKQAEGVYKITKISPMKYILDYYNTSIEVSYEELATFCKNEILKKNYIIQKYIDSVTPEKNSFDLRIHFEKTGYGNWRIISNQIRIGLNQKTTTNWRQGGGIIDTDIFMKLKYGSEAEIKLEQMKEYGLQLAAKIELLRKTKLATLSIDLGIDHNDDIFIFEANDAPVTTNLLGEIAMLRTDYYRYLLKTIKDN
ncbi:YheC/YheD family protein [Oceanobacillus oncorhynchi]|uniref:Endospore coat-associated protein YheD n=2 Tax=Oceanobacillus TaxID=182709 RepID=A0A0A1MCT3_9BACI|nr:YheC/YheD family protein [Oceanobacillus oncorhynchi]UUI39533.1 YheC/YheD family protein [Oceanobacillus oncorhynchi]CEI80853.1 Endospore coat-associated protein YheD [Oceanobacillus oncorhynchi]